MKRIVKLHLKQEPQLPVEAETLCPDKLAGLSLEDIYRLGMLYGNVQATVGEYFDGSITEAEGAGECLILEGDLRRIKRLGQGMAAGEMIINGDVGFHTGAEMSGGSIGINGSAGDWLGAHMSGGSISVSGDAGHWAGGAYRGKAQGMRGGAIIIHGNAGRMVGTKMRGGLIAVCGDCQEFPGYAMNAGTIVLAAGCGRHIGSGMIRGTIILMQQHDLLPTFYYNCQYEPTFWPLLANSMRSRGVEMDYGSGVFRRYSGESLTGGKGEVLICQRA